MVINFPSKEKSMVALQSKKEAVAKANKFITLSLSKCVQICLPIIVIFRHSSI
jgi:hypothetical protein